MALTLRVLTPCSGTAGLSHSCDKVGSGGQPIYGDYAGKPIAFCCKDSAKAFGSALARGKEPDGPTNPCELARAG
jgi:hypothetical protein